MYANVPYYMKIQSKRKLKYEILSCLKFPSLQYKSLLMFR